MILAKPAENLTGVTAEGSFDDFYELTDSISGGCFCGFVCPGAFFYGRDATMVREPKSRKIQLRFRRSNTQIISETQW